MSQQESSTPIAPFTLDTDAFTIGELEEIEELSGTTVMAAANGNFPIKLVRAVAFVSARRTDPKLKFEDMRGWSLEQLADATRNARPPA